MNDAREPVEVDLNDALDDSKHVTLARALEEASASREACLEIKNEMLGELELFRSAMRQELKVRKKKFDLYDGGIFGGLVMLGLGLAVAFHWAYSLIVVGCFFVAVSIVPLVKGSVKPG